MLLLTLILAALPAALALPQLSTLSTESPPFSVCSPVCVNATSCVIPDPNSLQCRICGVAFGDDPYSCFAANASFDGIEKIPTIYQTMSFTNLSLDKIDPPNAGPVAPSSHKRVAVAGVDKLVTVTFPIPSSYPYWHTEGSLQQFAFGCSDASRKSAVPCTLSTTSYCQAYITYANGSQIGTYLPFTNNYTYVPTNETGSAMALQEWVGNGSIFNDTLEYVDTICESYTFSAKGADGEGVVLYLDNLLSIHWFAYQQ